ncbi:hypothetical protein ElyMa_004051500 [Elysia marginata]|uniref:Uncharacterized protein n=1 Tax=Elysia marginata TaxID=1093978 RepID=A0AAV4G7P6_9GAST|nr:hypothetical protein ElyMa_004051500 [Elysia marginata]
MCVRCETRDEANLAQAARLCPEKKRNKFSSSSSSAARIICFSCIHVINSSYFIIILIIFIIINMSGKIIIIITTTIIIIITNGNLSINISSHTDKKDKNCDWQCKIVEIVESGVAKKDHI